MNEADDCLHCCILEDATRLIAGGTLTPAGAIEKTLEALATMISASPSERKRKAALRHVRKVLPKYVARKVDDRSRDDHGGVAREQPS